MSSWVRYSVAVYIGLLISGALARQPWRAPGYEPPPEPSVYYEPPPMEQAPPTTEPAAAARTDASA